MGRHRGSNEGSIRRRRIDGRWEGRINLGWQGGKRIRKSVYGHSREQVAVLLSKVTAQRDAGLTVPRGRDTLGDYLTSWLTHVRATVRPRTWGSYEEKMRLHVIPEKIGKVRLSTLQPKHIRDLLTTKLKKLSPRSVTHVRTILSTALNQAVADKLLPWNPVTSVKRPKAKRYNYQHLEPAAARAFLDAAQDSRYEAAITVTLALGLRRGETMGLRWSDVDLEAGTLQVQQTIQRISAKVAGTSGFHIGEPKTDRSRRQLAIPKTLIPILRRHRARQAQERLVATTWYDNGLVFTNRTGGPIDPQLLTDEFKNILKRAGLPAIRFHDLRHSAASLLLAKGEDLRTIMELLGHSTIALTANTYGHVSREMLADAAKKMDGILGR